MTTPQTASLLSDHPGWGRALVASLPRSLRVDESAEAGLTLIDGQGDWTRLALTRVTQGCRKILIAEPGPAEAGAIIRLADAVEESGANLILSERFASDPALPGFRDWLGPTFGTITVESISDDPPETTVFTQLRLLRASGYGVSGIGQLFRNPGVCLIETDVFLAEQQVHIRLSAAQSNAGLVRHLVSAYAPACTARLELALGGDARPAKASLSTAEGELNLPSIHESAHRHQLRALLGRDLTDSASALRAFADDAVLASTLGIQP
jgi:hypothetical protein